MPLEAIEPNSYHLFFCSRAMLLFGIDAVIETRISARLRSTIQRLAGRLTVPARLIAKQFCNSPSPNVKGGDGREENATCPLSVTPGARWNLHRFPLVPSDMYRCWRTSSIRKMAIETALRLPLFLVIPSYSRCARISDSCGDLSWKCLLRESTMAAVGNNRSSVAGKIIIIPSGQTGFAVDSSAQPSPMINMDPG